MAGFKPHFADNGNSFTIRNVNTGELETLAKTSANKPLYDWAQRNWGAAPQADAAAQLPAQLDPLAMTQSAPLNLERPPEETLTANIGGMSEAAPQMPMAEVAAAPAPLVTSAAPQQTTVDAKGHEVMDAPDGAVSKPDPAAEAAAAGGLGAPVLTEQQVQSTRMSPGAVKAEGVLKAETDKSIKANEALARQVTEEERIKSEMRTNIMDNANREILAKQQEKENKAQAILTDLDDMMQEYRDAKVDPKKLFHDMSTPNRVMAGIGLLFGAIGSGAQGPNGQNEALNVIEKAIDRDLDAQKANINKMGNAIEMQRGLLGDTMKVLGDEVAAREAAKTRQLEWVDEVIKNIAANNPNPRIDAQAQATRTALADKILAGRNAVEKTVSTNVYSTVPKKDTREGVGDPTLKELESRVMGVKALHDIEKLSRSKELSGKLGPAAGRIMMFLNGVDVGLNKDEKLLMSKIDQFVAGKIHEASGTGASDAERKSFVKMLMNVKQSPENFLAILNDQREELEAKIRPTAGNQEDQGRRGINLQKNYERAGVPWNGKTGSQMIGSFTGYAPPTSKKK